MALQGLKKRWRHERSAPDCLLRTLGCPRIEFYHTSGKRYSIAPITAGSPPLTIVKRIKNGTSTGLSLFRKWRRNEEHELQYLKDQMSESMATGSSQVGFPETVHYVIFGPTAGRSRSQSTFLANSSGSVTHLTRPKEMSTVA